MNTAEQIYELVQRLPSLKQMEVLDFASYLEQKKQRTQDMAQQQVLRQENKPTPEALRGALKNSKAFADFAGALKDSKTFEGDPVAIQRAMRDEWVRDV